VVHPDSAARRAQENTESLVERKIRPVFVLISLMARRVVFIRFSENADY
jgi:hypothetical protein